MTDEELKKRYLQYMHTQLEWAFDMETTSTSSKNSNKTMEDLEKSLNQDSDEEIPPNTQDPNIEEIEISMHISNKSWRSKKESINKKSFYQKPGEAKNREDMTSQWQGTGCW